ncbi:SMI1/KNR4 family protein [Microcoleus sp. bin38.metabat.b11b12b14.051]|uniref:WD40 domain-containing protein n=1 Tax=Microcoleus sp. bin38.metabat.b11b12b14.051 TaxID=2742709 RepID=UPI0025F1940E|nr:SMI1/KNR4 family protein [Microcoleus sp. bin38.metabat.b11b12b14.051]
MQKWQSLLAHLEVFDEQGECLTEEEMLQFETTNNIKLPKDYKKLSQVFGSGRFGEFIIIYSPIRSHYFHQFPLETIQYEITNRLWYSLEELEKNMNLESIADLLKGAFVFGEDGGTYIAIFDLKTYSESDYSCDIYWVHCPEFDGGIYHVGRDFWEFVCNFCLGTKSYKILPISICPDPSCLVHTFTCLSKSDKEIDIISLANIQERANISYDSYTIIETSGSSEFLETSDSDEFIETSRPFDHILSMWENRISEDFRHLHLPSEYIWNYFDRDREREREEEDREIILKAIQNNNSYALFRYIKTFRGHSDSVYAIAFTPDGQTLASGGADRTIKIWDLNTGQEICTLTEHTDAVVSLIASPDGKTLLSGSADNTIKIWNLSTSQVIHTLTGHTCSVLCLAISPDGTRLASGAADSTIIVWDLNTYEVIHTLIGHNHTVLSVAISPDGKTLASASADTSIKLWDLESGTEIRTLEANCGLVFAVRFHPSGQMLASVHEQDKSVKFWHPETGKLIRTMSTEVEIVSATVSPDWTTLAGGGGDVNYLISLWDLEKISGITYFDGYGQIDHKGCVYTVAFSPDGQTLASGSKDTTVKLWGVPPPINIE